MTIKDGALVASEFTPDQPKVMSGAFPLVDDILNLDGASISAFSVCPTGSITFMTGTSDSSDDPLYWLDVATNQKTEMGQPGEYGDVSISPDGELAVLEIAAGERDGADLWLLDLETELMTRFTFAPGTEQRPVWSPNSDVLFYAATVDSTTQIIRQAIEGQGHSDVIYESAQFTFPTDISPDGHFLLMQINDDESKIVRLSLTSPDAELEIVKESATSSVGGGVYSPDGRWIAYHAESESNWDVFVMAADGGNRVWQITTEGTVYPKWAKNGTAFDRLLLQIFPALLFMLILSWQTRFSPPSRQAAVDKP